MRALVERCRQLADQRPTLADLGRTLRNGVVDAGQISEFRRPDPSRPYGRHVFLDEPTVEGMIATWSRTYPCVPHDHGGSSGAVLVLEGCAVHRVWKVIDGRLELVLEERATAGDVLVCGPDMVHSMGDGGEERSLVTLHLYVDPIDHMVVYDRAGERTMVVDGGCGAWVPLDRPELIRTSVSGYHRVPLA